MNSAQDSPDGRAETVTSRTLRPAAWGMSLVVTLALGIGLCLVLVCHYRWMALPLVLRAHHAWLLVAVCVAFIAVTAWVCIGQARLWFLCIPPALVWAVLSSFLVLLTSPIAHDNEFFLDCAQIRPGDPIERVESRMRTWWRDPEHNVPATQVKHLSTITYKPAHWRHDGFVVFFDAETRRVVTRRYVADPNRH